MSFPCSDSASLKLSRSARAGETARFIRESRDFVAMESDCKGATRLDANVSVSCNTSNLSSIFVRLVSILEEACRRFLRSEHADSSLVSVGSSSVEAMGVSFGTENEGKFGMWGFSFMI